MLLSCSLLIGINIDYVWFLENVKENARERKYEEKMGGKKNEGKKKN